MSREQRVATWVPIAASLLLCIGTAIFSIGATAADLKAMRGELDSVQAERDALRQTVTKLDVLADENKEAHARIERAVERIEARMGKSIAQGATR